MAASLVFAAVAVGLPGGPARVGASAAEVPPTASPFGVFTVPGWAATRHVIGVGGRQRSYLVARPDGLAQPHLGDRLPVLVLLHGREMTPSDVAAASGMLGSRPAIVVLPAGYGRSWNAGGCCAAARAAHVDDVAFVRAVVARVLAQQPDADPHAVYLAGYSNGGRMAYRLACRAPGVFTAVAAVEAISVDPCSAVRAPVPLLVVASTGDPLLRLTPAAPPRSMEGYPQPSVTGVVRSWRGLDGCGDSGTTAQAGALTRSTWSCSGGAEVALDVYRGGSHRWPAGSAATPSAQAELWAFFTASRHA